MSDKTTYTYVAAGDPNTLTTWSGYVVVTDETGRRHSKHPLQRARALAQLRILYAKMKSGAIR